LEGRREKKNNSEMRKEKKEKSNAEIPAHRQYV